MSLTQSSDRLDAYLAGKVASNDMRLLTMHYGPRWRMIRKVLHSMLHVTVAKRYVPYQSLESKQMLQEILDHPEGLMESLQRYSNSLTTQMTFGWRTISNQDPKLTILFESLDRFEHLAQTGIAAVVDFFPILQALPGFLMPLKAFATKIYDDQKGLYVGHWLEVKSAIQAGTSKPCLSVDLAKLQDEEGFSDEQAAFISGKYCSLDYVEFAYGHDTMGNTIFQQSRRLVVNTPLDDLRDGAQCVCRRCCVIEPCSGD